MPLASGGVEYEPLGCVVTLAISDVPGDDLAVIASGPMVGDATTCEEALSILENSDSAESNPKFAEFLRGSAKSYAVAGKLEQAKGFAERALAIQQKIFEPDHPDQVRILAILSGIYRKMGDEEKADEFRDRAKKLLEDKKQE